MAAAIAVEGLRLEYPGIRALDDVSFEVPRGSETALASAPGNAALVAAVQVFLAGTFLAWRWRASQQVGARP